MGQTLSSPLTEKVHCLQGEDDRIKYAASSMQGWRITMEDAHTIILNLNESTKNSSDSPHVSFIGVYDGHGGTAVAQYAGQNLHSKIAATKEFGEMNYEAAMKRGFLDLDAEIAKGSAFQTDVSGCTACTCLITPDWKAIIANAGDSRAVLSRSGRAVPLSVDHKPYNEKESERITRAGGFVQMGRVNGNLALSRALGDLDFKKNTTLPAEEQAVTANPDVFSYPLVDEDELIIIACDGIWDCLDNQEVIDFVRLKLAETRDIMATCNALMHHCLADSVEMEGVGCDNMTVVITAILKNKTVDQWFDRIARDVKARNLKIPLTHPIGDDYKEDEETEPESEGDEADFMRAVMQAAAAENENMYNNDDDDDYDE